MSASSSHADETRAVDRVCLVLEQLGMDRTFAADRLRSLAAQWPGLADALANLLVVHQGTVPMVWRDLPGMRIRDVVPADPCSCIGPNHRNSCQSWVRPI